MRENFRVYLVRAHPQFLSNYIVVLVCYSPMEYWNLKEYNKTLKWWVGWIKQIYSRTKNEPIFVSVSIFVETKKKIHDIHISRSIVFKAFSVNLRMEGMHQYPYLMSQLNLYLSRDTGRVGDLVYFFATMVVLWSLGFWSVQLDPAGLLLDRQNSWFSLYQWIFMFILLS